MIDLECSVAVMEVQRVIEVDVPVVCLAYNRLRKEIYSAGDGERGIKVHSAGILTPNVHHAMWAMQYLLACMPLMHACPDRRHGT